LPVKICRPSLWPIRIHNYIAFTCTGILKSLPYEPSVCVGLSGGELAKLVLVLIEFVNNSVMATTFHRSPSQRALATFRDADVVVGVGQTVTCQLPTNFQLPAIFESITVAVRLIDRVLYFPHETI